MYEPGVGTWFTMTYELHSDGRFQAAFDYDTKPACAFIPEAYASELARFPRDPEHIPAWLQDQLDRVPNLYMTIHPDPATRPDDDGQAPDPDEVVASLVAQGWRVRANERRDGAELSNEWARLEALASPWQIRLAGKLDPDRWDDFVALFTHLDWNFGAELYDENDDMVRKVDPQRPTE
jgi:hypothetical protein